MVASTILKNMQVRRDDDYSQLNGKIYQMFQTNQRVIVIHYYSRIVSLCVLLEWRIVEPEKSLFSNPYRKSFFPKIHIKFSRILRLLCVFLYELPLLQDSFPMFGSIKSIKSRFGFCESWKCWTWGNPPSHPIAHRSHRTSRPGTPRGHVRHVLRRPMVAEGHVPRLWGLELT